MVIKAVLFDIDGTLVRFDGAGKRSLKRATEETFGTSGVMDSVHFQGKTDPLIVYESLIPVGISRETIDKKLELLKQKHFSFLDRYIRESQPILLPGVKELLERLNGAPGTLTGLLTGNFEGGARIKLKVFDLMDYFKFGVFSDDTPVRNQMPGIARKRIQDLFGWDIPYHDMFIIGDTPFDIECGKSAGAVTIAVGTGWTEREILQGHHPDYYFDDLADTSRVLKILLP